MGQEALRCINGLLPQFTDFGKTLPAISTKRRFTVLAAKKVIVGAIVF
jgi:hypothetical protein